MTSRISLVSERPFWRERFSYYWTLSKPVVTLLVVVTVVPAVYIAAAGQPSWPVLLAALVGTALTSASAAVCNQLVETSSDASMRRTRQRPCASGQVSRLEGALLAAILGLSGLSVLAVGARWEAALVAAGAHLFYAWGYTCLLKPSTPQNIVIGGASGAVGPLIGWAAVNGQLGWPAWAMFAIIFLWTPPHFWALAILYLEDYRRAGLPMYPVVYGVEATLTGMRVYSLCLLPAVASLLLCSEVSWFYGTIALGATAKLVRDAFALRPGAEVALRDFFHYSCSYILLVFAALTLATVL